MPARISGWHHHVVSTDKEAAWRIKQMELLHIQLLGPWPERLSRKLVVGTLHKIGLAIVDKDFAPHIKRDHEGVIARIGRHLREELDTVRQHFERALAVIEDVGTPEDQAANAFRDRLHRLADDGACIAMAHQNEV